MRGNTNRDWLTHFLFTHTRQTSPDGRPLYAYKMSDVIYEELRTLFNQIILNNPDRKPTIHFAPIFCLYAAETFRRKHTAGPWTWETIFGSLNIDTPSHQRITEWVEKGLKWWGRPPLLRSISDYRLFLITIACEGGLPLRLLQQENAHLTQFFRTVLEGYYRSGQGSEQSAETIARQQSHLLPRSLRQEPVFYLAAKLITKIGELQACIGEATDLIAALDQQRSDWRRDLPLRLDDRVAETLLAGLVRRYGELARETTVQLRWQGLLRKTNTGWIVEKCLKFPEQPTAQQIAEWIGASGVEHPRWRLLLHTCTEIETIAWLTLAEGAGSSARYRREWLRRSGLVLVGAAVEQMHRLSLYDGQRDYPLSVRGSESWGTSPWIFVERGTTGAREWLTEGSAQTRAESAWVAVAPKIAPQVVNGACECIGIVTELGRMIYQISGEVDFLTAQQDRYRISCRAESESEESFLVSGDLVPQSLQQRPLYRGLPRIQVLDREGRRQSVTGHIQWRSIGDGSIWRETHETARGRIWLRLIDTSGAERCRRQVDVAPHDFYIEADIGTGNQVGVVQLSGLGGACVQIDSNSFADVSIEATTEQARIVCPPTPSTLPLLLSLVLHWAGSEPITLDLPYPQRGAFFQQAGRPLPNDDWIPLDRLGGLHLVVQDPMGGQHFWLEGELITHKSEPKPRFRQRFHDRLPPLDRGQLETALFPWQDRIASLLASSQDLEAQVRLVIETAYHRLALIRVTRFDALFEPDKATRQVRIPEPVLTHLGPAWETHIRLEMIRLWAPAELPVVLHASPSQITCWDIPADLEPGPWWIVGRDDDWARFRPLLWVATTKNSSPAEGIDSSLAGAIRESNHDQREQRLNTLLTELGENPDHPDWLLLFDYVRLAHEFPPSSLDVLRQLPAYPRTLALALFKADDKTFESVWSLSQQMPFLWVLLTLNNWREAATTYFRGLQVTLAEVDSDSKFVFELFQSFRERANARRSYWRPLCDWLQELLFPEQPLKNSELIIARCYPSCLEQQIALMEQELQGRHVSGEKWPESPEMMRWQQDIASEYRYTHLDPFYQPVRCAPFIAAHLSLNGITPNEQLIYELRLLRAFDREWFDNIYAITLTLGLAQQPLES